jgi:hypothetical protein
LFEGAHAMNEFALPNFHFPASTFAQINVALA